MAKKMNENLFQGPFYNLSIEKGYPVGLIKNPKIKGKIHKGKFIVGIKLNDPSEEHNHDDEINDDHNVCNIDDEPNNNFPC